MKEQTTNYIAYVDASGCDGYNFEKGSTKCYVVAVLLTTEEDDLYNKGLLLDIKKILRVSPKDEVKYNTMKNHKNRASAHSVLGKIKGELFLWVAFKTSIEPTDRLRNTNLKSLSAMAHTFPILALKNFIGQRKLSKLNEIYIDRMKNTEETAVDLCFEAMNEKFEKNDKEEIMLPKPKFKDSKAIKLLQVADFFAGCARDFFERYMQLENQLPCALCSKMKKKNLCKYKKNRLPFKEAGNFKYIHHLVNRNNGQILFYGINPYPVKRCHNLKFVDCLKI